MPRVQTFEAVVLKTYDIGDTDRFCVLLTREAGRLVLCAKGARKPGSRYGSAMQSFQHLAVDAAEHSSGLYLRSAECHDAFPMLRGDVERFLFATEGCDLLLRFLHESEPSAEIFALTLEYFHFLEEAPSRRAYAVFLLSFLRILGLMPSFDEHRDAFPLRGFRGTPSPALRAFLVSRASFRSAAQTFLSAQDEECLQHLCDVLIRENLSAPLRSEAVVDAMRCTTDSRAPHSPGGLRGYSSPVGCGEN